jgi:alpha-tubulin suppressor-like RCC1 family protein
LTRVGIVADEIVLALLKEASSPSLHKRDSLHLHYARHLVEGDSLFHGFPATAPQGVDTAAVVRLALVYAVSKQVPLAALAKSWLLAIDSVSLHARVAGLVAAGMVKASDTIKAFPPYPVRVRTPLALGDLLPGQTVVVQGAFVGDSGLSKMGWEVVRGDVDRSGSFRFSFSAQLDGKQTSWDLAKDASATLTEVAAGEGTYQLAVWVSDAKSRVDTSRALFQVLRARDGIAPVLRRSGNFTDQSVTFATSTFDLEWTVSDNDSVVSVTLNGIDVAVAPTLRKTVNLAVGSNGFKIVATDAAGNASTDSVTITRQADLAKPGVAGPVDWSVDFETDTASVTWTIANLAKVASIAFDTTRIPVSATVRKALKLEVGANRFVLTVVDLEGGVYRDTVVVTRAKDAKGPVVSWVSPSSSKIVEAGMTSIALYVQATDPSGVDSVTIQGVTATSTLLAKKDLPLVVGENVFTVVATDTAGNATTSKVVVVRSKDAVAPIVVITSPKEGAVALPFGSSQVTVVATADDGTGSGIDYVTIGATKVAMAPYTALVSGLKTGANSIIVNVFDKAGNMGADTVVVVVAGDAEVPGVARVAGTADRTVPYATTSATVSWTVTDNDAVALVKIGGIGVASATSTYSRTVDLEVGANTITIEASDKAGNSITDKVTITRLNDTVKAVVASDANSALRAGSFWVKLSCPTSGAKIHYTLDGTTPTEQSSLFKDSILIDTTRTLKARAFAGSLVAGPVLSITYSLALPVAVWGGGDHTLVLMSDHSLWGFGNNARNGFAAGATTVRTRPVKIADSVAQASAGLGFSMWVKLDGSLWGIGRNDSGALAIGTNLDQSTPVLVTRGVKKVFALLDQATLFLKSDGSLWAAGDNRLGQLGIGTRISTNLPMKVASDVIDAGGGMHHSYFLKSDGSYWSMGAPYDGRLGLCVDSVVTAPSKVLEDVAVIANQYGQGNLIAKQDGSLWAFGWNSGGLLGLGGIDEDGFVCPARKVEFSGAVRSIWTGTSHSLVMTDEGWVWGAGANDRYELGSALADRQPTFVKLASGVGTIGSGYWNSFYITTDGRLFGAGANGSGQLGLGRISSGEGFSRIKF